MLAVASGSHNSARAERVIGSTMSPYRSDKVRLRRRSPGSGTSPNLRCPQEAYFTAPRRLDQPAASAREHSRRRGGVTPIEVWTRTREVARITAAVHPDHPAVLSFRVSVRRAEPRYRSSVDSSRSSRGQDTVSSPSLATTRAPNLRHSRSRVARTHSKSERAGSVN